MRKSIFVFVVLLCLGCSERKVQDSPKFTDEQIAQLGLSSVKPLRIFDGDCIKLDFNGFLSEKEISAQELVDSVEFISLETTNESLIAEINKLVCVENYFFIFDSDIGKNVFIFLSDGRFVKRIPTGQGPEEIYNPGDIAVDKENGHLIVYNRKGLSFYDYQGNFVKRELLPFNFKNFRVLANGYLFVTIPNQNGHLADLSAMQVFITDKNFRIISAGFPFHYSNTLNYGITDYTSSLDKNVSFAFKFSTKIFQYIDTLAVEEKYQLDFSKKEIPSKYMEMS
ncbi:6-bladed beta-propeller, partial [Parabacteroides sp. OttesenSCG-928-B22]|nr:6-bladed beta-propeller [Parabacteroides sp. OttesenSCG-928-B22]